VAIPQNYLQAPRTRWLRHFFETFWATRTGRQVGSANAHVDSPHEESMHRPDTEDVDHIAPVQLSGGPSAPPWRTSCVSRSSSSSPLGPSTKTASQNMHAPRDLSSHEPRPEHRRGRFQASPLSIKSGRKVAHNEQSYPKPTVVPERVPLRLDHTVSAADPSSFNSHVLWKGTILAWQLTRTSTTTLSKLQTKYLLRGGQQEQRKSSSMKTSFMIRPGCDVIDMNQILKVTMLRSSCLFLGLPHQMMLLVDERPLAYKGMIPARRILMTLPNHEKAKNVVWRSPRWTCIKLAWCM